jgi:multicomponent Na+:H+ antiporter subunit F
MILTDYAIALAIPILSLAILLVVARIVIGPSAADRVVALDLLATLGIGVIAVLSIIYDQVAFLDAAIILALVSYLATITFAYYLEKRVDQ